MQYITGGDFSERYGPPIMVFQASEKENMSEILESKKLTESEAANKPKENIIHPCAWGKTHCTLQMVALKYDIHIKLEALCTEDPAMSDFKIAIVCAFKKNI